MHYITIHNDKEIYPFLFDLIVMSFIYTVTYFKYEKEFNSIQAFAKKVYSTKEEYLSRSSDDNYYYNELIRAVELLPNEYKEYDPALVIVKHYSELLKCDYKSIANVLRQLRVDFADNYKPFYSLAKKLKSIQLNFEKDDFRKLSLLVY